MIKRFLMLSLCAFLMAACGGSTAPNQKEVKQALEEESKDVVLETATNIFYSMPSPLELTTLLKSAGGTFQNGLMHDPDLAGQYQTKVKQAMNLGIYGADLSYASVYSQRQECIKHLAATKRIGDQLGINEAFSAELLERANANLDNRDSMLHILTEIYWQSNSQLQEEDRGQVSVITMAAGWLEGLYLGSHIVDANNPDREVVVRIMEQKYTSGQLKEMLSNDDDPSVSETRNLLTPLFEFFDGLTVTQEKAVVEYVESTGVARISGKSEINYSEEQLAQLQTLTTDIRSKMIEL